MLNRQVILTLIIFIYLLTACFSLFSQPLIDPNTRIYRLLTLWHENGYINYLPPIRPYAPQLVKKLLTEVMEKGDAPTRQLATEYYNYFFPAIFEKPDAENPYIDVNTSCSLRFLSDFKDYFGKAELSWNSTGLLSEIVSYSWLFSIGLLDNPNQEISPQWSELYDESCSGGGQMNLNDNKIEIGQLGMGGLFIGNNFIFFQAGLMRTSFGPFFENGFIIGPQCPAASHFSLTYITEWITFSSIFLDLVAKYYEDTDTGDTILFKEPKAKFLMIHSVTIYPLEWFTLSLIQSVIFGEIFHPVYLLPLNNLFYTQQLLGDWDSSFIGVSSEIFLPCNIQFDTAFYIDDWDAFSGPEKKGVGIGINLDSAQNKFALQLGLSWSPEVDIFKRVNIDYLMITPYTFTHFSHTAVEYLSYTHSGEHIGSVLEPNSDQVTLSFLFIPIGFWDIDIWGRFVRHGNASDGYEQGNGTIYDDGCLADGTITFYGPSRFLTQYVIEYVIQAGFDTGLYFYFDWGRISLKLWYTFEYIWNKGLVKETEETNNFINFDLGIEL